MATPKVLPDSKLGDAVIIFSSVTSESLPLDKATFRTAVFQRLLTNISKGDGRKAEIILDRMRPSWVYQQRAGLQQWIQVSISLTKESLLILPLCAANTQAAPQAQSNSLPPVTISPSVVHALMEAEQ